MSPEPTYDVAVLGGGNAALCAALAAAERGARVIVIERAPRVFRGGNSRHVRNLRCMHTAPTDVLTDAYAEDEFMADLLRVTGGATNETLARMMVRASADAPRADAADSASASSPRCAARCSSDAPTRSFSAAAKR